MPFIKKVAKMYSRVRKNEKENEMSNYTKLTATTETELNRSFEKVEVAYWIITDTRTNKVILKTQKDSKKGKRIAAHREILEQGIADAVAAW